MSVLLQTKVDDVVVVVVDYELATSVTCAQVARQTVFMNISEIK